MKYPALNIQRKTGQENFTFQGRPLEHNILHFWQWHASDLMSNALTGC